MSWKNFFLRLILLVSIVAGAMTLGHFVGLYFSAKECEVAGGGGECGWGYFLWMPIFTLVTLATIGIMWRMKSHLRRK